MSKSLDLLCDSIKHYASNLSDYEIAKKCDVPQSTISRLLKKERLPNLETLDKISIGLNVEPYQLLEPIEKHEKSEVPIDIVNALKGQPPHVLDTIRMILINLGSKSEQKLKSGS